jgi:peptide/nickel transport system permease protein
MKTYGNGKNKRYNRNNGMLRYAIKRIVTVIPVFIGITAVVFILMSLAPGSTLDAVSEGDTVMSVEQYEALKKSLGLDKPIVVRYFIWLRDFFQGHMGISYRSNQEVSLIISQRILPSVILSGTGIGLAVLLAIPIGIMAAYKPYSRWDSVSSVFALLGATLPGFFIAILGIYIFSIKLGWLPSKGMSNFRSVTFFEYLRHLLMPAVIICFSSMGNLIKQTRGACLEVFNEEYIKTARSKGISEARVVIRHGFRNAMIPVVTSVLLQIPNIIGGSTIIEQIFGWPGIGSLMISSINNRDYPVIMGVAVLIATAVLVTNIILDMIYVLLDPRITHE